MPPRNFLNINLRLSPQARVDFNGQLEAAPQAGAGQRPGKRRARSYNLSRIPKLLMLGYASEDSQRRYEKQRDWKRFYSVLMFKIENITIVSGLLLASSCNLLIAGELRRMTHTSVSASIFGSILSVVFGLLCRINITPGRLEFLVSRTRLFYYLYSTPSLFGGAAALVFFVAVCAYTWLEESTAQYGWEAKTASVVMSGMLIANAVACFVLGAGVADMHAEAEGESERLEEEQERKERKEEEERERNRRRVGEEEENDILDQRNRRTRIGSGDSAVGALGFSSFGIAAWGVDNQSLPPSDQVAVPAPSREPPTRATTVDSADRPGTRSPRRMQVRRQSKW